MPIFRRRPPDPALVAVRAAFDVVASWIDAAQRALLAAIPTSRDPGVPLAQAIAAFGARLDEARAAMPAWRIDATGADWLRCDAALKDCTDAVARLRLAPGALEFEGLNDRIGDVLHHLDTFADVERALRRR